MTTVFVIAAVLLGAEGGEPAPVVTLKQPVLAEQSRPAVVNLDANADAHPTTSGLVKPVGYQAKKNQVKVSPVAKTGGFSIVQDSSPSDSVAPQPMPASPMVPKAPKPVQLEDGPNSQLSDAYVVEEDYTSESCGCASSCDSGCNSCGCHKAHGCNLGCKGGCHGCGYGLGHGGFYARHCLPSPWHAPGNMVPHIPYVAYPKTYYYFRPYNMLHIPEQQARAANWVANPALPYSNGIFDKVYAELEPILNAPGEVIDTGT